MAKPSPTLYSVEKTFFWFAIISVVLTTSLAMIVLTDYTREWKSYQKQFVRLKIEKAKEKLKSAEKNLDAKKIESLKKAVAEADLSLKNHRSQIQATQKDIEKLDSKFAKTKTSSQDLKQFQDSYKYYFEEFRLHQDPKADEYASKLKALEPRLAEAKLELEDFEKQKETLEAKLQSFYSKEKALQKDLDKALEEKTGIEKQIEKLKPTLAKDILNAPMIDFVAPSLRIQQVVLEDLTDDYHFAKVQKVDRCTTCHLGIDQKGFENAPEPFKTHPKLELYLGSASPHPIEKFGCTVCHGGNGHSVSFKDSAHMPQTTAQGDVWKKKYHWEALEKWDAKMLPLNYVQASCAKCHNSGVQVPQADRLNEGRRLARTYGCFNYHKIQGFSAGGGPASGGENSWKVGAGLEHVQSKLSKEWIIKWLHDPTHFRASTKMPKVFHLSNTSSPEEVDRDNAAIESIAVYLLKNSESVSLTAPPVPGDAQNGEKLVKEIGCLGCHSAAGLSLNKYAAELSGLGSKVTPEWLYSWLKDPKHYLKNTRMPNLRLTDQQAADITSYLLSLKNEKFDQSTAPAAKLEVVNQMIVESLQGTMRRKEAEEKSASMTPEERFEFLGKKSILHQGCFTCHSIKGFSAEGGPASGGEDTVKPIGADLSNESRKDIHQFDFGFVELEPTRQAWIEQKLKDPRIYDKGKVKAYYDKLRMPQFNLTDEQRSALTTFVLSLTQEQIPLEMQKRLDLNEVRIEKGRLLVQKLNCNGCHTFDGKVGSLRQYHEDEETLGSAPPMLDGEGAKVQEKWLHEFLKEPSTIRPWLTYHMPTFNASEEELGDLVETFAFLSHRKISYQGPEIPQSSPEKLRAGKELFEKLQCIKCHQVNTNTAVMGTSFLAPDLTLTKKRLKPDWVHEWIQDPQKLDPGTMMPAFFPDGETAITDVLGGNTNEQIQAIRDYLYQYEKEEASKTKP